MLTPPCLFFQEAQAVDISVRNINNISVTEQLVDKNTGESVTGKTVYPGQVLSYQIHITNQGSEDILINSFEKDIPKELTVGKNVIFDQKETPNEAIPSMFVIQNNHLDTDYLEEGDLGTLPAGAYFNIYLDVTVNDVQGKVEVTDGGFTIHSGRNRETTPDYSYTIQGNNAPVVTLAQAGQKFPVVPGSKINLTGHWRDADGDNVDLYYRLDNQGALTFDTNVANTEESNAYQFQYTVPQDIPVGLHVLSVYAVDSKNGKSNEVSVTLNVSAGTLELVNVPNIDFGTQDILGRSFTLFAQKANQQGVSIEDTRLSGSRWRIMAREVSPLTNSKGQVLGNLAFTNAAGTKTMLSNNSIVVAEGTTTTQGTRNITWEANQGFSVDVPANAFVGAYQGEVEWQLQDVP